MNSTADSTLVNRTDNSLTELSRANAANDDRVASEERAASAGLGSDVLTSTGWNSYDVWRRLIKDPRDRRAQVSKVREI